MRTMNHVLYIGTYLWAPYLSPSNGRNYDGNSSQDAVKQIMEPQESINHLPSTIQDLLLHVYRSGLLCFVHKIALYRSAR